MAIAGLPPFAEDGAMFLDVNGTLLGQEGCNLAPHFRPATRASGAAQSALRGAWLGARAGKRA